MRRSVLAVLGVAAALVALAPFTPPPADASHAWGPYHWARTSNPFTLKLGDNLTSAWDPYLMTTSSDWSKSTVLDTTIVAGSTTPRQCRPKSGRVEVCNAFYGNNGWLGIAQIWVSGTHITQGAVKLNDTYFNQARYNTTAWRNLVTCQEVGHTLGLNHQDENFSNPNLGTCMDYTNDPSTNQHPNQHDYDQLALIYAHLDSTTTIRSAPSQSAGASNAGGNSPREWGEPVRKNQQGQAILYGRDLSGGQRVFTFVVWADASPAGGRLGGR